MPRRVAAPQQLARLAIQRESLKYLILVACEKDAVRGDGGRGLAHRDSGFPDDILPGPNLARQRRAFGDPTAVGSTEAGPLGGGGGSGGGESEEEEQETHEENHIAF